MKNILLATAIAATPLSASIALEGGSISEPKIEKIVQSIDVVENVNVVSVDISDAFILHLSSLSASEESVKDEIVRILFSEFESNYSKMRQLDSYLDRIEFGNIFSEITHSNGSFYIDFDRYVNSNVLKAFKELEVIGIMPDYRDLYVGRIKSLARDKLDQFSVLDKDLLINLKISKTFEGQPEISFIGADFIDFEDKKISFPVEAPIEVVEDVIFEVEEKGIVESKITNLIDNKEVYIKKAVDLFDSASGIVVDGSVKLLDVIDNRIEQYKNLNPDDVIESENERSNTGSDTSILEKDVTEKSIEDKSNEESIIKKSKEFDLAIDSERYTDYAIRFWRELPDTIDGILQESKIKGF